MNPEISVAPYHLGLLALGVCQNALTAVAYRATWQRVHRLVA
ncbi:MAG: hypothetical protein RLZZ182_982, partial [Pseudomonadota bacterium]